MSLKKWRHFVFIFIIVASIQYHFLAFIGMCFYGGGTNIDPFYAGYSFFNNFLSDLGRTMAFSGAPNGISCLLFTIHSIIYGISFTLLFLALPKCFKEGSKERNLSIWGSTLNIITGGALVAIGIAPWDITPLIHEISFAIGLITTFFAAILYFRAVYLNEAYANRYAYVFLLFALMVGPYSLGILFGPSMNTPVGLTFQVIGQKILTYTWAVCFSIIGYSAFKYSSNETEI